MREHKTKYIDILISGLKVAFLSFGGGASAIPYIKNEYINNRKWVNEEEFSDMVILSNLLPGPTISQIVMLISKIEGGYIGALAGLTGLLLPTPIVLLVLLHFMSKYMSKENIDKITFAILPVVLYMLVSFIIDFFMKSKNKTSLEYNLLAMVLMFLLMIFFKIKLILILLIAIILIIIYSLFIENKIKNRG